MDFGPSRIERSPFGDSKLENGKSESSRSIILTNPYQLSIRSTTFREKYMDHIGYTVQAKQSAGIRLGINALEVYKAIECLGFKTLREDMAEHLVPDDEKLSLLVMTSSDNPALCGTSYLMIKPHVGVTCVLCNKRLFIQAMQNMEERMLQSNKSFLTGSGNLFGYEYFLPLTLSMDDPNLEAILAMRPGTYLTKPASGAIDGDQGQQLVRIRSDSVNQDLQSHLQAHGLQRVDRSQLILQAFIERPLLVDKRKFDIRVYLLLVNPKRGDSGCNGRPAQAGYFAFQHPGFVRLCSEPYDPDNADMAASLTDQSGQAKRRRQQQGGDSSTTQLKEVTTWYPDELNLYLNKKRRTPKQDWTRDVLYPRVGAALGYVASVFRFNLDDREGYTNTFRILGVDLLLDECLRLHLLDINECPSWNRQTTVLGNIKPNLWREAICLSSEIAIRYKTYRTISDDRLVTRQNFRIVYSSEDPCLARRNVTMMYED